MIYAVRENADGALDIWASEKQVVAPPGYTVCSFEVFRLAWRERDRQTIARLMPHKLLQQDYA